MTKRNRHGMGPVRRIKETKRSEDFIFSGLNSNLMETDKEKGVTSESQPLECIGSGG
jgi:hypothetical protein